MISGRVFGQRLRRFLSAMEFSREDGVDFPVAQRRGERLRPGAPGLREIRILLRCAARIAAFRVADEENRRRFSARRLEKSADQNEQEWQSHPAD